MAESDVAIHVAAVIKDRAAQVPIDGRGEVERNGKSALGIQNEELMPAGGSRDLRRARRGIIDFRAQSSHLLRSGAIQRKAAQAIGPAGKESFADGDMTRAEGIDKSQADVIGPDHPGLHLAVVSVLPEEARKVVRRPQKSRTHFEIQRLKPAAMGIERFIARIENERSRKHRGPHVLVLWRDEILDQKVGEGRALERVAELQAPGLGGIQELFQLK